MSGTKKLMKTNKITILGGGSAGWMAAATLISQFPNKEITVVESPNIPTVGVGESTLGYINEWLDLLDIKDEDFIDFGLDEINKIYDTPMVNVFKYYGYIENTYEAKRSCCYCRALRNLQKNKSIK